MSAMDTLKNKKITKRLTELKPREHGIVLSVGFKGSARRRLIDMGITPGASVIMKKTAPLGDPIEICIRGYELSLRKKEAMQVEIAIK